MTTQPQENYYEVIVWDYDAAPDAQEVGVYERRRFRELVRARNYAWEMVHGDMCFVGAVVFKNGEKVCGFGSTFRYPDQET